MEDKDFIRLTDRMKMLCSRREYCSSDIRKKVIAASDGDDDVVGKIMDELVREKYIDDRRYASAFARDKSSLAGWGASKIRYMLSSKGISRQMIAEALSEIDGQKAGDRLEKLMANKLRSLKDDPQCRLKMLRFGLGRGYEYDEVSSVLDKLMRR